MQLQQLEFTVKIAEVGSMNKAAKELFVSQPYLSKVIQQLEEELGFKIFDRKSKGISLTPQGIQFYHYARAIVHQVGEIDIIFKKSDNSSQKRLYVSSYPMMIPSTVLSEFYNRQTHDKITLTLHEYSNIKVIEDVSNGTADVGLIIPGTHILNNPRFKQILQQKEVEFNLISSGTVCIMVGPHHPLYHLNIISFKDLLPYPAIRLSGDAYTYFDETTDLDSYSWSDFKQIIFVDNLAAMLNIVKQTNAFKLSDVWEVTEYERFGLRSIPLTSGFDLSLGWLKRKNSNLSEGAQLFIDIFKEKYQDNFVKYNYI